jgi:hypothetical protein
MPQGPVREIACLISTHGLATVLLSALIIILLKGKVNFRYPHAGKKA